MNKINWYKNKVCINVLAKDLENAIEIYKAAESFVVVGILSKSFSSNEDAEKEMTKWSKAIENNISIGLGGGDPKQSYMVAELTKKLNPAHANQVFTGVGLSRANYTDKTTFINCLVSPTGTVGMVKISTGPNSSKEQDGIVPIDTAIEMIKDMGGDSIKFFNMAGLKYIDEFKAVAISCAKHNFALEPTGGIDKKNFSTILKIAIDSGVQKIIPHVYTSIIDPQTGKTKIEDVAFLMNEIKNIVK